MIQYYTLSTVTSGIVHCMWGTRALKSVEYERLQKTKLALKYDVEKKSGIASI